MKLALAAVIAFTCALVFTPGAALAQPPVVGGCSVFPADDVWNTPIDTLPVDGSSAAYVTTIGASLGLKADFGAGLWDGGPIGIPFVTVNSSQPYYPVTFDYADESDPGPYAVPVNAPIEGGSASNGDRHALSIDTSSCTLYELYYAFPQAASWTAGSGAIYNLSSYALRPAGWTSADAAGLPIFPGLVRYDEVASGEITHAIRFTVPQTRNTYTWPARHKASTLTGTQYPPMGERFRLKASFDTSGYSTENQVILRALKKYGMILADNGSSWYMSGAPDERWNNSDLHLLGGILGSNFEAVDESSLMIDPNSGQAHQPSGGGGTTTVSVSPASASVVTGATRQFTATVTPPAAVTWSVNGVTGGNATVGTISAAGVYTAPSTVPSPATVTVKALSSSASGTASVTMTPPAVSTPQITSVSPTSVAVGSFTLTINGSGFQAGAVVRFGTTNMATTFLSATKITVTGTASATSSGVPVSVRNADGGTSNSVNVAVTAAPVKVAVSPQFVTLKTGQTQQFQATVTNTPNTAVAWKVNGIAGGNAKVGTISASGLYRAPANPTGGFISVTATSVADATKSASAVVTVRR